MTASWRTARVARFFPDPDHAVDPYLVWARLSGFAGFQAAPGRLVPVIFELGTQPRATSTDVAALIARCKNANPLNRFRPTLYGTAVVDRRDLPTLAQAVRDGVLARFQLGLARGEMQPPARKPRKVEVTPGVLATKRLQTIGVIDDGCCLAHERFRSGYASRFVAVWDQDAHAPADRKYWNRSGAVPYGVTLRMAAVNDLFAQDPDIGEVAERAIYKKIGREDWGMESRRHGAGVLHVLADSAGRFIFVQLPGESVADTSGGSLGVYLIDGVRYIAKQTEDLAQLEQATRWSTTINVSLGSIAGPHDGTTIAEAALAELAADRKIRIVLAAGNTASKRVHGMRSISRDEPGRFFVMVPPDNPRESYVELWLPERRGDTSIVDPADFEVELVAPDGSVSPKVGVDQAVCLADGVTPQAAVVFCRQVAQGKHGTMVLVAFRSTRISGDAGLVHANEGVWSINLLSKAERAVDVHAWVERNDLVVGRRRPQQAFFVSDPEDDPERSYVNDQFTLSSIANGANVTVVGGYRMNDETVVDYSAQGPTRGGVRRGPDMLGPSDESTTLPGMLVGGFFSGWTTRMSGTSVAAPHVARWLVKGKPSGKKFVLRRSAIGYNPPPIPGIRP